MKILLNVLLPLGLIACANDSDSGDEDADSEYAGVSSNYQSGGDGYADASGDAAVGGDSDYEVEDGAREPFDEDAAEQAARDEVASMTYRDAGMPYGCTDDCSGHSAGFAWAAKREDGTGGYNDSNSFQQGKQAYEDTVSERVDEMRDDYENGDDPDY